MVASGWAVGGASSRVQTPARTHFQQRWCEDLVDWACCEGDDPRVFTLQAAECLCCPLDMRTAVRPHKSPPRISIIVAVWDVVHAENL